MKSKIVAALVMASALSLPSYGQSFSDWSAPVNLGPTLNTSFNDN